MPITTVLFLTIGLPVLAWLAAAGIERLARRVEERQRAGRRVDQRFLWAFICANQLIVCALEWQRGPTWMAWLTTGLVLVSATTLLKYVRESRLRSEQA